MCQSPQCGAPRRGLINIRFTNQYQHVLFYWHWGGLRLEGIPEEMLYKAMTPALSSQCWFMILAAYGRPRDQGALGAVAGGLIRI